jgi:hypothetical protein
MLYDSTKTLLWSILQSLEVDNAGWEDQMESGKECLYELHQMSHPLYKDLPTGGTSDKVARRAGTSEQARRAIPHVKNMVNAIRRQDRASAVASSKAALAEMNGATRLRAAAAGSSESKEVRVGSTGRKSYSAASQVAEGKRSPSRTRVASAS